MKLLTLLLFQKSPKVNNQNTKNKMNIAKPNIALATI
jgi:hypothetical protein